ncbi:PEBP-like protein [Tuber magnatum]|uniref:Large ribosomal subunit protein mL38 n=1 Tax=Tuber magnatum TaxID=42249 RepID=A0A317T214_9PEZI|nr:PEBP-like protein [Tuber magnatum]
MSTRTLSASSSIRVLGAARFHIVRSIGVAGGLGTRSTANKSGAEDVGDVGGAEETEGGRLRMRTIESMPFQTYQLALDIIHKDRQENLKRIAKERETLEKLIKYKGLTHNDRRIVSMKQQIERWKIYADANNPRIKYNFDCGIISMDKPIYLNFLNKKWRQRNRPILMQRLETMHVIPDVLPNINPIVDVRVHFKGRKVQPGQMLDSLMVEEFPTVRVIPFKNEEILCTIAVVDPDVPDPKRDKFRYRCHWIVSNIPISPAQTTAVGRLAKPADTIVPYLPPHAQKGVPYHRYAMIVFRQPGKIDRATLEGNVNRDNFTMRSFQDKNKLCPIGASMWRVEWDSHTKEIMQKHGLPGWDTMYKRIKDVVPP